MASVLGTRYRKGFAACGLPWCGDRPSWWEHGASGTRYEPDARRRNGVTAPCVIANEVAVRGTSRTPAGGTRSPPRRGCPARSRYSSKSQFAQCVRHRLSLLLRPNAGRCFLVAQTDDVIEVEGIVVEPLPNSVFWVTLGNDRAVVRSHLRRDSGLHPGCGMRPWAPPSTIRPRSRQDHELIV